ncbi:acyltransferase family protein [Brevundimonas sp.]|uniref:acyltransferase family protein n=1 Tax=Brevundimonas sp. TaxID=1871086 RepID=UPI0025F1DD00|nr:acyltransferase family protein [Brevundimonas sp.]
MADHTPAERLHGLDALRGGALLLGVVLHAAMAYLTLPVWPVGDAASEPAADALFFGIHLFRMSAFFLIAGLFGHMLLSRRGWGGFIRDRLSRIALPLVVFWPLVFAGIIAVILWKAALANGGTLPTGGTPPPPLTVETFPLTHLWFLWVLLILYVGLLALRAVVALNRSGLLGRTLDRTAGGAIGLWSPALFAAPLALVLSATPDWYAFFGVPTPDYGPVPNAAALTAFGLAFLAGVFLDRRRDLLKRLERAWAPLSLVAVLSGVAAYVATGGSAPVLEPIEGQAKVIAAWTYALALFASTFAVTALALRFASGHSRLRHYLADASYWTYIVHLPLVMVGHVLLADLAWPWFAKLAAVTFGVLAVCLITYELLVRHTFMGRWLNGRAVPWGRPRPAASPLPAE